MQRMLRLLGPVAILLAVASCDMAARSPQGFVLPEGNAENGQKLFISLGCTACHTVKDLDLPAPDANGPVTIVLGGGVTRVKSYGELVSSIVNPSHRLSRGFPKDVVSRDDESLMTVYNDVMTVTELIDVVAFLQSEYEVIPRPGYRYPVYSYKKTQ
jgi:sulfur-oxidizing protein SoxX